MTETPAPALLSQPSPIADVTALCHQKEQVPRGVTGSISSGVNGREDGAYSDPHGTVFIDHESHAGAWAKFLKDVNHGERNAA